MPIEAIEAATAFFDIINIISVWIAVVLGPTEAPTDRLGKFVTAILRFRPVISDITRAFAPIRVISTSRSDGNVEKENDEGFHDERRCKMMCAMTP